MQPIRHRTHTHWKVCCMQMDSMLHGLQESPCLNDVVRDAFELRLEVCVCIERETTAGAIILFQSPLGVSFCWRQRGQSVYRTLMFAIINNSHWLLHSLSLLAHPFTHLFLICFNHLLLTDIIARVHWHSVLSQLLANSHCWLYLLQTMMRLIINAVMLMFCLLVKNNVDDTQTHTQTVK